MEEKQCDTCIFKNRRDVCTLKNIRTEDVDYDDCWFYKQLKECYEEDE